MIINLSAIGKPNTLLDIDAVTFLTKVDLAALGIETLKRDALMVRIICGGSDVHFPYSADEREQWEATYAFFRDHLLKRSGVP